MNWLLKKMNKECAYCKIQPKDVFYCGKCKRVQYCSRLCQRVDWKTHKDVCVNTFKVLQDAAKEFYGDEYELAVKLHIEKTTQ